MLGLKVCFWALSVVQNPVGAVREFFQSGIIRNEAPHLKTTSGPRIVGRNEEGGLRVHDIAFVRGSRSYRPIRITRVGEDGSIDGVNLSNGKHLKDLSIDELSRDTHPRLLSEHPIGVMSDFFKQDDPIQLRYKDAMNREVTLTGNYMGFNQEGGYYRFLNSDGEKVGVMPESIVPGSLKSATPRGPKTIAPYYDPAGIFQIVTSRDPLLVEQNKQWMQTMRNNGVNVDYSPDVNFQKLAAIEKVWREKIVSKHEDTDHRTGMYGEAKMKLYRKVSQLGIEMNHRRGDVIGMLGPVNEAGVSVCVDLSLSLHYMLSEMGIRSSVVGGRVPGGGHAWLEVYDRQGRVIGIIDSNNTKAIHPSFEHYRETMLSRTTGFPRDIIIEDRQVIREAADMEWWSVP